MNQLRNVEQSPPQNESERVDVVVMNRILLLFVLFCSGCCTAPKAPRQLRFEQGEAWFYKEDERRMRVERFEPMKSEAASRWFTEDEVVNFKYSWDPAHFELCASLVIRPSGNYELISGEDEVIRFLGKHMKNFRSESDILDFLELFTSMRGYTLVNKAPEVMDMRVRQGKKVSEQDYTLNIHETDISWNLDVSIEVNWMSGSIHRYKIKLPKSEVNTLKVNRGKMQYFSDYIR